MWTSCSADVKDKEKKKVLTLDVLLMKTADSLNINSTSSPPGMKLDTHDSILSFALTCACFWIVSQKAFAFRYTFLLPTVSDD